MTKVRLNWNDSLVRAVDRYIEEDLHSPDHRIMSRVIKAEREDLWDGDIITVGLVINADISDYDDETWVGGFLTLEYQKDFSEDGREFTIVLKNLDEDAEWSIYGTRQEVVKWFEPFGEGW